MKTINLADVAITERSDRKDDVGCRAGAQPVLSGNIARRICLSARRSWSRIPPSSWSILSRPSSERVIAAFLTVRPLCPPIFGMKWRRTSHDENAIGSVLAADLSRKTIHLDADYFAFLRGSPDVHASIGLPLSRAGQSVRYVAIRELDQHAHR